MCGIAGWFNIKNLELDSLKRMLDLMQHRGPDGKAFYSQEGFHAGMVRLAINGLNNGDQPLFSFSGKVVLLYNGEIYNSSSLRRSLISKGIKFKTDSDGEVLCHLFELEGSACFQKLDGMFAAALWNTESKKLTLVRDIQGEKPLYYVKHMSGGLIFASEIKALNGLPNIGFSLNRQAISDFPTFLWTPEPQTIFNEVKALKRGHFLEFSPHSKFKEFSYRPEYKFETFTNEKEAVAEIRKTCDESIESRLLADVPVGSFLSGGLDSSIIATQAAKKLTSLTTFCIGFEESDDPYHGKLDESSLAQETASLIGSTHHTVRVSAQDFKNSLESFCWYGDQPFAVSSGLGIFHISKLAKSLGIKVLLSGDGADECFGGYSWYEHLGFTQQIPVNNEGNTISFSHDTGLPLIERLDAISKLTGPNRARAWHYYASDQDKLRLFHKDFTADLKSSSRIFSNWKKNSLWTPEDYIAQDRDCYLPNEMLRKVDRMTMAHSVEGRTPFCSASVLALADRIPYSMMKGDSGVLKKTLRKAYSDILSPQIISTPKHGFNVPIDKWLKNQWKDLLEDTFSKNSALASEGIISARSRDNAFEMLEQTNRLNGHTLFCFIMLNLWLEKSYGNYC